MKALTYRPDAIIGIDQTGALQKSGSPKTLPTAALIYRPPPSGAKRWRLYTKSHAGKPLALPTLSSHALRGLLTRLHDGHSPRTAPFVVVDSVLGLPSGFAKDMEDPLSVLKALFVHASNFPGWGRDVGFAFFQALRKTAPQALGPFPLRDIEAKLGAQSVFKPHPFQKNIQTGTFRIWKDLGAAGADNFQFLHFQDIAPESSRPILCEGYPTLAWHQLNQSPRTAKDFQNIYTTFESEVDGLENLESAGPDQKDAVLLALLALKKIQQKSLYAVTAPTLEGHILGASEGHTP